MKKDEKWLAAASEIAGYVNHSRQLHVVEDRGGETSGVEKMKFGIFWENG
jgi:hypothetical protein